MKAINLQQKQQGKTQDQRERTRALAFAKVVPNPQKALVMLTTAGVLATGLVATAGPAAHAATLKRDTHSASYFVAAINAQRVAHHRPKLTNSATMSAAALRWATDMAKSNELAHNPHLASSVTNWRYLGENVGVGYSASSLESAFYNSPGHRANMLDTDFTQIGVAVVVVNGKMWVAEEFRRPAHVTSTAKAKHSTTSHKAVASHKTTAHHTTAKKPVHVHYGSRGSLVRVIQRLLHISADGIFGRQTRAAVESFQRRHHLHVTGVVGPKTLAALKR